MIRLGIILLMWLYAPVAAAAVPDARALWERGAYREAFAAAFERANAGDPQAEYILGEAYRLGRSVDPDENQARDWYLRAARQGEVASAAALGEMLLRMRQAREAVPWLTLAASHNHARAMAFLAAIYFTGDGADQDLILATSLMKRAAALGSPEAKMKLALMDDTAAPVDVSSPPSTRAVETPPRAADAVKVVPTLSSAVNQARLDPASRAPRSLTLGLVRYQVGAFRSAANATRACQAIAAHIPEAASNLAVIRTRGYFKVLLLSSKIRGEAMHHRLVQIGWQHFPRYRRLSRA